MRMQSEYPGDTVAALTLGQRVVLSIGIEVLCLAVQTTELLSRVEGSASRSRARAASRVG